LSTVAEGVETTEQLRILRTLGCEQSQGYLHGRPVAGEAFEGMLTAGGAVSPVGP
jgi:diguanylate cyclase